MASLTTNTSLRAPSAWVIPFEKITFDQILGQGSFGTVHLGQYQLEKIAIKKIHSGANKAQQESASRALQREVKALTRVRHPNIVRLIGVCDDPPMLIMAFAEQGSLRDVLDKNVLSLNEKLELIKGVARGMFALHDNDIMHLDLKPQNVLIQDKTPWITDFGLAFAMSASISAGSVNSARGTMQYKAPESFRPRAGRYNR